MKIFITSHNPYMSFKDFYNIFKNKDDPRDDLEWYFDKEVDIFGGRKTMRQMQEDLREK